MSLFRRTTRGQSRRRSAFPTLDPVPRLPAEGMGVGVIRIDHRARPRRQRALGYAPGHSLQRMFRVT